MVLPVPQLALLIGHSGLRLPSEDKADRVRPSSHGPPAVLEHSRRAQGPEARLPACSPSPQPLPGLPSLKSTSASCPFIKGHTGGATDSMSPRIFQHILLCVTGIPRCIRKTILRYSIASDHHPNCPGILEGPDPVQSGKSTLGTVLLASVAQTLSCPSSFPVTTLASRVHLQESITKQYGF